MSFSLTRKTDYALLALARLSQAAPSPGDACETVSARHIAHEFGLPLPLLTNILKDLQVAGLISSRRGACGGYSLARPADRITLAQVVAAIEGTPALARCCSDSDASPCPACQATPRCPITHSMHRFNDAITLAMNQLTLAQMMQSDLQIDLSIRAPRPAPRPLTLAQTA